MCKISLTGYFKIIDLQCSFVGFFLFSCLLLLLVSCEQKSEYERRVENEQSKDVQVDSLFLGYYFGMTSDEFFAHSWDLNSRKIVTGQQTIFYELNELKSPASMEFYPQFKNDKLYRYPIEVHYDGWAPWNKEFFADSLVTDLVHLYEKKYNSDFFKSVDPESKQEAYIDIQGNRQISIYKRDDRIVNIVFLDLSVLE